MPAAGRTAVRRVLAGCLVLLAGLAGFLLALLSPVETREPWSAPVLVLSGESLPEISAALRNSGVIREAKSFELLVRLRGKARELKAGPYRVRSSEWGWEILDRLVKGDFEDTSITVTEGLWMAEIAERLDPFVQGGGPAFLGAARDASLLRDLGIREQTAEGYLFPDTYRMLLSTPAPEIVRQMVRTFFQVWERELAGRAHHRGMSLHDVLTLASIVEAEARVASERPRIAAVYLNRLAQGVLLQADPTVHYGLGQRRARTFYSDLKIPSPYNTYVHAGLPPGPIGNPGLQSMRAVLWPKENCRDLYFVALGDGTHLFATDFAGHQQNRRLVRERQVGEGAEAVAPARKARRTR